MNAGYPLLKARTVLLFAGALVAAGLASVLYALALLAGKFAARLPGSSWAVLPSTDQPLYLGFVLAAVGLAVAGGGILLALRQKSAIRVLKQRSEDRLRRLRDYQTDDLDGRREPFIGSGGIGRNADRRVA